MFQPPPTLLTHSTYPFAGSPEEEALQWAGEGRPVAVSIPPSKEVGATFWSFVVRWPRERAHHWWGWGSCCCHWERSVAARLGMPGLHVQQPGPANNLRDLWRCAATCRAQYTRGRGYRAEQWRQPEVAARRPTATVIRSTYTRAEVGSRIFNYCAPSLRSSSTFSSDHHSATVEAASTSAREPCQVRTRVASTTTSHAKPTHTSPTNPVLW